MKSMLIYILIIFLLPLISFFLQLFLPKRFDILKSYFSSLLLFCSVVLSSLSIYTFIRQSEWTNEEWGIYYILQKIQLKWVALPDLSIGFGINFDKIAIIMLLVVSLISFLVHFYSHEYMKGDKRFSRYYAYLGLFTFSMNGIVLSNNLFFTFIFWELVGVSSFLLIGFWYEKNSAGNAAKKAFLVNRIGDIGMFLGIMMIFFYAGTFSYSGI